jgi:hypothetical protein
LALISALVSLWLVRWGVVLWLPRAWQPGARPVRKIA